MKKLLIFVILITLFAAQSQAQDTTNTQNSYFLEFVKKVYFNPTVLLRTQKFREDNKVRALVLPDLNGGQTNQITGFEKAMQKIIRFLIEGDDKGSIRFYFDSKNTTKPFSFVCSDELWCKFPDSAKDSIEKRLNTPFQGTNFNLNSHVLFETAITGGLNYASSCLQNSTAECSEEPDNKTTEINTKPLSISLHNTSGSKFDIDTKQFDQLESHYAKATDLFTQQDWYAPAKVIVSGTNSDEPVVLAINKHESLFKKENLKIKMLYNSSILPVLAGSTNDSIRFNIPKDLPKGNPVEVVVTYKSPVDSITYTVGFFMIQVMEKQTKKLNLLAANGFNVADQKTQIENELKKVYDPVGIAFEVTVKTWDPIIDSEWPTSIQIENSGLLSNYPPDLRDWVNGVQDLTDYDNDEYYLVFGLSTPELAGYMPRARNIGFIFSGTIDLSETVAHELGHGVFHLRHIFAEEELGEQGMNQTRNVMDYKQLAATKLKDLYLHQWKFIDDPAFVSWFGGDDEEALSTSVFYSALDDDTNTVAQNTSTNALFSINLGALTEDPVFKISENQYAKFKSDQISNKTAVFSGEVIIRFEDNGLVMKPTGSTYTISKKDNIAYYDGLSSIFFCNSCTDRTYKKYIHSDTKKEISLIDKYSPSDIMPVFVACENVSGYYYPENSQLLMKYPVCPPSGQIALKDPDEMPIPHNWKFTDSDDKRCVSFVCPDKSIIKLDVTKIKKARFTRGLQNEYHLETLADGFLLNFVYDNGNGEKTYKAKIDNHVFKGYVCNSETFEDYLALKDGEFAVMLLPFGVECIPYKVKYWNNATSYASRGARKVIEIFGEETTFSDEQSHFMNLNITTYSNHIEKLGTDSYYLDESKYGMNTYGATLFSYLPESDYSKINDLYWFISKISQLKSKYPLLYPRMTTKGLFQWNGWTEVATYTTMISNMGSIAVNWLDSNPVTNDPVENYFLVTDNLVAGYFDYIYTKMGWGYFAQTPKEKFYLGKFYKYYKRLIHANKVLSQEYINTIKNANCTSGKTVSIYHNNIELNTTQIYNAITSMSVTELEGLCNTTRTRLVRHLIYPGSENLWLVTNGLEKIVLHILNNTPENDQAELLNNFCTVKYSDELLIQTMADAIDDETCFWGDDYFSEMVGWVTKAYNKYQGNPLKNRYETNQCTQADLEMLKQRICVYNYTGFVKRLGKGIWYTVCSDLGLTAGNNPLKEYLVPDPDKMTDVEFTTSDKIKLTNYSEICFSNVSQSSPRYLDPMEPVFIDDKGNLMDIYAQSKGVLMPAVALYFIEQAAESRTTVAVIQTVVDVVTFVIPGAGPIKLLTYADKLSSVASLTSAYFEDDNPELAKTLGIFSAVLGFADFANTSSVAAKFDKFQDFSTDSQKALVSVKASNMSSVSQESKLDDLLKKFEDKDPDLMAAMGDHNSKEFAKRALVVEESAAISNPAIKSRIRKVINGLDNLGAYANHSFYNALGNKLSSYWGKTQETMGKLYKKANSTQSADLVAEINNQGELIIHQNKVVTTWADIKGSECVDILPASSYKLKNGTSLSDKQLTDLTIYRKNNELICTTAGNCFPAGTKVILADGRVINIQDIQVGDIVASLQESTQTFTKNKVVQLFKRTTTQLTRIVTVKDTLWATPEHPFYTVKGWINAGSLASGILLQTVNGQIPVESILTMDSNCTVYNFEVEQTHNYLIGNGAYVVHNSCSYRKQLLDDGLNPSKVTRLQELENTNPALYAQIKEANLSVSKVSEFLDDFGGNPALLKKFDDGEISVDAWKALEDAKSSIGSSWKTDPTILQKLTGDFAEFSDLKGFLHANPEYFAVWNKVKFLSKKARGNPAMLRKFKEQLDDLAIYNNPSTSSIARRNTYRGHTEGYSNSSGGKGGHFTSDVNTLSNNGKIVIIDNTKPFSLDTPPFSATEINLNSLPQNSKGVSLVDGDNSVYIAQYVLDASQNPTNVISRYRPKSSGSQHTFFPDGMSWDEIMEQFASAQVNPAKVTWGGQSGAWEAVADNGMVFRWYDGQKTVFLKY